MSDTSAFQDHPPSVGMKSARNSSNTPGLSSSSSALPSQPDSPDPVQEISYFPSDSANPSPLQNRKNDHLQPSGTSPKRPCGPCYTRDELFHLKKSPLVAPPTGMPARKDWFGEYNEQPSKPKDHDGQAASRIRHRRDADPEDPTRSFDSTRPSFKSGPAQPSQMGSFRLRDRSDIDKDTASLKSMAERYDRGERLPSTMAGLNGRVKDRDATQHFNSVTPRIGAVPRRAEGREPRQRKLGDEANDWRKNADPARERAEARGESTRDRRERDASRSRGGDDSVGERRRRDRSRDDESRRWREEGTTGAARSDKERRGREPSSTREDRDINGTGRGKKRGDDEERAEANRRRKEERDKETPAWFDDDEIPTGGTTKGIVGAKIGDELDELQKWKLEKRAREEEKEREEREATMPSQQNFPDGETNYHESAGPSNLDEHKTPRPSNVQPDLLPAAAPPPLPTQGGAEAPNPLDQLKALMGMQKVDAASQPLGGMFGEVSPSSASGNSSNGLTSFSNIVSRPPQASSAINYDAMAKASSDEARRPIDFDPPAVSRHAFAQPRNNPSPSPTDTGFGHNNKYIDQNGYAPLAGPPGLRPLQSAEPSRRTRNLSDMHAMAAGQLQQQQRSSQNASPVDSHGGGSDRIGFMNRQPPPHMNGGFDNAAPLLHLPLSAGPSAAPRDGSGGNVLSVAAPQPQHSAMNIGGPMVGTGGAPAGVPHRGQNGSPQQNLLARLGILPNQQERKPSPKTLDGPGSGFDRPGVPNDLRMPMPQQHYGTGPPSALNRGAYGSPVDDRLEPSSATMSSDGRYPLNQGQNGSAASSNFGPSPVGGNNPTQNLSAKGSRLAKFFDPRGAGEDVISPASMHSSGMGSMDGSMSGRGGIVTPPYQQFENNNKNQAMPDLLALLQGTNLHGSQAQNGMGNAQQSMYREEMALRRQREVVLQQQQQQQLREARLEQQMYGQNPDLYDRGGSFVANDLVPGLRPPIQRSDRDLYNSDRLDERLAYAAQGRVPGVPGSYDQMMRNMNVNPPLRGPNMYAAQGAGGAGGMSGHLAAEILQQQQHQQQQRERQRQLQQRQEIERAQLLAMQSNQMGVRNPVNNLSAQLGPRQNSIEQYSRGGRIPVNDIQSQQFGGYGGLGGGPGGMNVNGGFGGVNPGSNQLNGYDISMRQQQLGQQQQQRQANLGMGYGGIGGVEPRYAQQNQLHGGGMHNQGGNQSSDLMALLLAGNHGNQQN